MARRSARRSATIVAARARSARRPAQRDADGSDPSCAHVHLGERRPGARPLHHVLGDADERGRRRRGQQAARSRPRAAVRARRRFTSSPSRFCGRATPLNGPNGLLSVLVDGGGDGLDDVVGPPRATTGVFGRRRRTAASISGPMPATTTSAPTTSAQSSGPTAGSTRPGRTTADRDRVAGRRRAHAVARPRSRSSSSTSTGLPGHRHGPVSRRFFGMVPTVASAAPRG